MRKINFSKSSLSACNARPVHTDGPLAAMNEAEAEMPAGIVTGRRAMAFAFSSCLGPPL